jgi:ADP-ribose pyrophosphatase YjhB (NUDIX family)
MAGAVIRPVALCVIRRGSEILVFEGHDTVKGETFHRPLGGGVEFGETGAEAVARELREELGAVLVGLRHLGTLENIFTYEGRAGHEIAFIYEADFADLGFYDRERLPVVEDGHDVVEAVWKPVAAFLDGSLILYPTGILDLLDGPGRQAARSQTRP